MNNVDPKYNSEGATCPSRKLCTSLLLRPALYLVPDLNRTPPVGTQQ